MTKVQAEDMAPFLRPLVGLLNDQDDTVVERITVDQIRKHRLLRDEAIRLQALYDASGAYSATERQDLSEAYICAMISVYAQQTVVSTMIDILGHIPEIPAEQHH